MVRVVRTPEAFAEATGELRAAGHVVGLVPTMGALHEGHLALVDEARRRGATAVAVTIFVNPLQFDRQDDLDRYPRTFDDDLRACQARDVELVFAPAPEAMYPPGFQTHVEVGALAQELEGAHRPGHFQGVTTVVAKLLIAAGPCVAVFGRKDYQQWRILDRMSRDLGLPVTVVGHPILREPDGLAMSSRNRLLSPAHRGRALAIARGLRLAAEAWAGGLRDPEPLRALARAPIETAFDAVDYVRIVDPQTLRDVAGTVDVGLLVVAAHLGPVRLIDNLELGVDPLPG